MAKRQDKRIREEEVATAHVFQEFLTSFQEVQAAPNKMFIRSGVLNPEKGIETTLGSQIYMPKALVKTNTLSKNALECAKILKDTKIEKGKNKERPMSNLELLKEEIRQRQAIKDEFLFTPIGALDGANDPNTTNLFLANLSKKITEEELKLLFGQYGPLASVKIMWPRPEEKVKGTNCGFVAFMSRKDAERAMNALKSREDMRITWGKAVEVPSLPIYIPQKLIVQLLPPVASGLPFNAQPFDQKYKKECSKDTVEMQELLKNSVVKVTIPLDKRKLALIHRVVEFVINEGALIEAMIMTRECDNPEFAFMFDYKSPLHIYYRWKLFSIMNGDSQKSWSHKPFRMFKNGSIWIPPSPIDYTLGMPDELFEEKKNIQLTDAQAQRLFEIIRGLNMSKCKIAVGTVFVLSHLTSLDDSLGIIFDSFNNVTTNPTKKVARLYLLNDIMYNCIRTQKLTTGQVEAKYGEDVLKMISELQKTYLILKFKADKEFYKQRVLAVIHSWSLRKIISTDFLRKIEDVFVCVTDDDDSSIDEPLDGANLLKISQKTFSDSNISVNIPSKEKRGKENSFSIENFVPSKWNEVDPEEVRTQAMSTQKLFEMELEEEVENIDTTRRKKKSKRKDSTKDSKSKEKIRDKHSKNKGIGSFIFSPKKYSLQYCIKQV